MYCPKCGTQNPDNALNCSACGAVLQQANQYQNPSNNYNQPNNQQYQNYNQNYNQNANNTNLNNQYGNYQQNGNNIKPVPNYLVQSILVTLFCCLPLGIVAIITSKQVDDKLRVGDYAGAVEASNKAKNYCMISLVIGIIVSIIYFIIGFIGAL